MLSGLDVVITSVICCLFFIMQRQHNELTRLESPMLTMTGNAYCQVGGDVNTIFITSRKKECLYGQAGSIFLSSFFVDWP